MEELLFESDKKEAAERRYYHNSRYKTFSDGQGRIGFSAGYEVGFETACSFKNNQTQEFLKWLYRSDWYMDEDREQNIIFLHMDNDRQASFSELFEIFKKETSK